MSCVGSCSLQFPAYDIYKNRRFISIHAIKVFGVEYNDLAIMDLSGKTLSPTVALTLTFTKSVFVEPVIDTTLEAHLV